MIKYGKDLVFKPELLAEKNIDRLSTSLIPENSLVLEIGCATGFMGSYLKKVKNCKVVGVDLGIEEGKLAMKKLDKVIIGDIEDDKILLEISQLKRFDVIFSSALVEHLKDPWSALRKWKKFLKKDGSIIITTPNIAHWSTRLKLLFGNFDYEEYGILDNSHLRFFTLKTFKDLVESNGYIIEKFAFDPVGGGMPKISNILSKFFPNLFAYQMVIKAKIK